MNQFATVVTEAVAATIVSCLAAVTRRHAWGHAVSAHPKTRRGHCAGDAVLSAICSFFIAASAFGQTSIWNGGNGFWSNPSNWTGGVPNSTTAVALIDNGNPLASTVTLDQNVTVLQITIDADDALAVSPNKQLSLANGGSINGSGTLANQGSVAVLPGSSAILAVAVNNPGGLLFGGTNGGVLTLDGTTVSAGTVALGGFAALNGAALDGVQLSSGNHVVNLVSGSLEIRGTVTIPSNATVELGNGARLTGNGTLANQGFVTVSPGSSGTLAVTVNNAGGLLFGGSNGGVLTLDATTVSAGTLALGDFGGINGAALDGVQLAAPNHVVNLVSGSLEIRGTATVLSDGVVELGNVSLTGDGTLANQGVVAVSPGSSPTLAIAVNNTGGVLFGGSNGGTLTLDGHTVFGGVLERQFGAVNGAIVDDVQFGRSVPGSNTEITGGSALGIKNSIGSTVTNIAVLTLGSGGTGAALNSVLTVQFIGGRFIFTPGTLENGDGTFGDRFATIQGGGTLNVPIINNGMIVANNPSVPLVISGDVVTDPNGLSVIRATNGATLTIDNATVNAQLVDVFQGKLNGIGTIDVNDNVGNGGIITPGIDAPGTLTINGVYTQANNGTLTGILDFLLAGGQSGQYSVLDVNGFVLFDIGSIIRADLFGGFDPAADCTTTFGVCDTFDVLHVAQGFIETGGVAGISGLVFDLPTLPNGLSWQELGLNDHHDLVLEVIGAVTGGGGGGGGSGGTAPEPASSFLVASGLLAIAYVLRRGQQQIH